MYPTITDLLRDLLGINIPLPVQTFGFFVMLAFGAAAITLWKELSRKEEEGLLAAIKKTTPPHRGHSIRAYLLPGIFGFLIGYKILEAFFHYSDLVNDPQAFILSSRGNLLGGILTMCFSLLVEYKEIASKLTSKAKPVDVIMHPRDHLGNIIMIALVAGLLGAKIFHNLENPSEFMLNPLEALFSFSGLTFYGGLIVATIALWVYANRNQIFFPHLMDAAAPGLMLAYGIGRMGCQLSGDGDWGIVNTAPKPGWMSFLPDWCWAFRYPHNVIGDGIAIPGCTGPHCMQLENPVFPTPLYESMAGILLFFVLWASRRKIKNTLVLFSFYLLLNGCERFLIERIRVNSVYDFFGGVTQAQIISFIFILAGASGIFYFRKNPLKTPTLLT
jgi:prolipoprotein diacylglyceryl transferase